jgi:2',3'-cyclic-nucleotide 2'-phosphodiesterase (5'-nucleotidase family)
MIIALNHMRNFEDQDMASQNNSDVVDLIFGGHDHAYIAKLNRHTDVNVLKSGTDFECFTNFTVLFGVEKADFDDFVNSTKFYENLNVDYSEKLKRMYISEKVYITDMFAPDSEILEHVSKYTQQLALIEE